MKIKIMTEHDFTIGNYDVPESVLKLIEKIELMRRYWEDGATATALAINKQLKDNFSHNLDAIMKGEE